MQPAPARSLTPDTEGSDVVGMPASASVRWLAIPGAAASSTASDPGRARATDHGPADAPVTLLSCPSEVPLIGRETEAELLLNVVNGRDDAPHALLILGEAGIGKTRLLRVAKQAARARRMRMLSAHGGGLVVRRPFAALQQLLGPVHSQVGELPPRHRSVLRAALDMNDPTRSLQPAALHIAVLALLDHLSRRGPLMLAVDAIQDCDRASADALFAAVGQLGNRNTCAVFTASGDVPPPGSPRDLDVLRLNPLPLPVAARLLDLQPHPPTGSTRLRVLHEAGGNPLTLLELSQAAESTGETNNPIVPRRQPRIRRLFDAAVADLPAATRHALLHAAAAEPGQPLADVMAAIDSSDLHLWTPAENAGLITVTQAGVVFRSPLARAATLLGHPVASRQAAHLNLARVSGQPFYRALHLAAATVGRDERTAFELEEAADLSATEGSWFSAARALEQAARLTPKGRDRTRRLTKALVATSLLGDPSWARDLYAAFPRAAADPDHVAAAACAVGASLSQMSLQREAFDVLLHALKQAPSRDTPIATALSTLASGVAGRSRLREHVDTLGLFRAHAERARRAAARDPQADVDNQATTGTVASRTVFEMLKLASTASRAYLNDDADTSTQQFQRLRELPQARRAFGLHAWTLPTEVDTLLATGQWEQAQTLIDQGAGHAAVYRLSTLAADLDALAATLRALRGATEPDNRQPGTADWTSAQLAQNQATRARILRARSLTALTEGNLEDAYRHLRALFAPDGSPIDPFLAPRAVAELATIAQRTGRQSEAARILSRVRDTQGPHPSARMTWLLHQAAALVDPDADPEQHFRSALADPLETWPLEQAQARLHYAIWLRRQRRRVEARHQLSAVIETADRLGARPLAEAARAELRAAGAGAPPAMPPGALAELTPQEREIVRLAAEGRSNREIGQLLFLSPRTVGGHLYRIYPKLGISRRHQLRDLILGT